MMGIIDSWLRDLAPRPLPPLAWGARVTQQFRDKVRIVARNLQTDPSRLMSVMAFETGRTFSAHIKNAAGSGAVGLIQFMPQTAGSLGTTTDKLAVMSAVQQLDYVEKYLKPFKGRLSTVADLYMAVLWPAAVGKPLDWELFNSRDPKYPKRYIQNAGLDFNKDGSITKFEAAKRVLDIHEEGLKPGNIA